jgi:uncharacterized membrane protein YjjP (DUF1212 family)
VALIKGSDMKNLKSSLNKLCQDLSAYSKYLLFEVVFFSSFGFVAFLMLISGNVIDNVSLYFLSGSSAFCALLVVATSNNANKKVESRSS